MHFSIVSCSFEVQIKACFMLGEEYENERKLDEVSNSRPLALSSPTRGFFHMPFKVTIFLGLLVIHLKHPLWFPIMKDIFTPEFLRKEQTLFAKSDELVTEFSAEV